MSWAYCAPKSTTRQVSNSAASGSLMSAAADHDELGLLLEVLERVEAAQRHGPPQGAGEVHTAGRVVGRAVEDLLQRALGLDRDPLAAGQGGVHRGHAPVVAPA